MENGKAETKRRKLPQLPSVLLNKIIIDIVMYSNASKVPNLFFKKDIYYLLLSYTDSADGRVDVYPVCPTGRSGNWCLGIG